MRSGGRLKKGELFLFFFHQVQMFYFIFIHIIGNPDCRLNGLSSGGCKIHGNPGFQEPSLLVRSYHRNGIIEREE
jgi:hypothetical protein